LQICQMQFDLPDSSYPPPKIFSAKKRLFPWRNGTYSEYSDPIFRIFWLNDVSLVIHFLYFDNDRVSFKNLSPFFRILYNRSVPDGNSRKGGIAIKGQIQAIGTLEEIKKFLKMLPDQLIFKNYNYVTDIFGPDHPDPLRLTCSFGKKPKMLRLDVGDAGRIEIPMTNLLEIKTKEGVTVFAGYTVDIFSAPKTKKEPKKGSTCKQCIVSIIPQI
ncbi:MAG: hypothetical protein WB502_10225, partial [Thermoactinomyces sp.]